MPFWMKSTPGIRYRIDLSKNPSDYQRTVCTPFVLSPVEPVTVDWGDGTFNTYSSGTWHEHTYADGLGDKFTITMTSENGTFAALRFIGTTGMNNEASNPTKKAARSIVSFDHIDVEFSYNGNGYMYWYPFAGSTSCSYVDLRFFRNPVEKYYHSTFRGNVYSGLTFDDIDLRHNEAATGLDSLFAYTLISGSLSADFFVGNPNVTSFNGCFRDNSRLTGSIPATLFANNTKATNFGYCFYNCSGLSGSIPADLFKNNTAVTTFTYTFGGCSGLSGGIPSGLFATNVNATNFQSTFLSCTHLTSIPSGLFDNNTKATNFHSTFQGCSGLTGSIPSGLFANCPDVTDFIQTFKGCSGLTGNAPELWNTHPNATGTGCFNGCTGLSNYASIPNGWK